MFVYLSKKIAIPNGVKLKTVSWNAEQGWIACGGESGLLKVLKLDPVGSEGKPKPPGAAANSLSMNQTLDGHNGAVLVVCWNEINRKLTTSDENGLIIVWMLHKGMWFEEMINNRNKSVVRDMKWSADGTRICIVYEDGAVIVGGVDGNRLWGKELRVNLSHVEWSPDTRNIVFGTTAGEVHIHEGTAGNFLSKMPLPCVEDSTGPVRLVGIDWYNGLEGYADATAPTLAVGFENGRIQLMTNELDDKPVLIDTGMRTTRLCWNTSGTVLAVGGSQAGPTGESPMIQFYNPWGQHLRTLKIPGGSVTGISWEGSGLRIAFSVDSFIYFANVRPDYKWGYFNKTLVYSFTKVDRPENCVIFWNVKTGEKFTKYVKKLLAIRAAGEHCVLAAKTDDTASQYILILCNSIGSPVDSKNIEFEPTYIAMTQTHVIAASEDMLFVWQYRTQANKLTPIDSTAASSLRRKEGRERYMHVDDTSFEDDTYRKPSSTIKDTIACITATEKTMLVGRESGVIQVYSLPHVSLESKIVLPCRPHMLSLNCSSTKFSVIDINGVLSLVDLAAITAAAAAEPSSGLGMGLGGKSVPTITAKGTGFERKDVWDMRWSDDDPDLFALMEKTRMYVYRGTDPEEPILSSAHICKFNNLKIKAVQLDEVLLEPENPQKAHVVRFETKSLRDSREILAKVSIADAYSFIQDNSHPRLWKLLAEAALERLDFAVADKAFVRCSDYQGIQFVKKLKILDSKEKQRAEVLSYFRRFEEAEKIYRDIDRRDLSVQMRMHLGDWFRVVQLVQEGGGDDALIGQAFNQIGEYYADRQKWAKAVQYYLQAKNYARLIECYYNLEDFVALEKLIHILSEGSPLLPIIGEKFASVGICENAVLAFLRGGEVKMAIDCCVDLNQWDQAVSLAEKHNFREIETLLSKYASHLVDNNKMSHAVELFRKANRHTESAKLLAQIAQDVTKNRMSVLTAKKLHVLAALEIERFRRKVLDTQVLSGTPGSSTSTLAVEALLAHDTMTGHDKSLDNSWRGAEACHFFLLAQRQLYENNIDASMKTAMRLLEYTDLLNPRDVYSLLGLASYYNKHFGTCSQAFMQLEMLPNWSDQEKETLTALSTSIFMKHPPRDPPSSSKLACHMCSSPIKEWSSSCPGCSTHLYPCIATGRVIIGTSYYTCKHCKHRAYETEIARRKTCPLCHSPVKA